MIGEIGVVGTLVIGIYLLSFRLIQYLWKGKDYEYAILLGTLLVCIGMMIVGIGWEI